MAVGWICRCISAKTSTAQAFRYLFRSFTTGRSELAAKDLINYLQREHNYRKRTRLVAVFVSSQMAGLFIHFIRDPIQ